MLRNIALTLAYDGTRYSGWQVQLNLPSVQAVVEKAIESLIGEKVSLLCAGRTDAGVHALGQVASFFSISTIPPENWGEALRSRLPADVVIRESKEVPFSFHATYSAKSKRYRYVILESMVDNPFVKPFSWRVRPPLDVAAMQSTAQMLVGTHDFRSFESHWPNTGSSVRTIHEIRFVRTAVWDVWDRDPVQDGLEPNAEKAKGKQEFVIFEVVGDGFLYNMVRAIVGTLVAVGRGRWTPQEFEAAFRSLNRRKAGETAPAQGLFLASVEY